MRPFPLPSSLPLCPCLVLIRLLNQFVVRSRRDVEAEPRDSFVKMLPRNLISTTTRRPVDYFLSVNFLLPSTPSLRTASFRNCDAAAAEKRYCNASTASLTVSVVDFSPCATPDTGRHARTRAVSVRIASPYQRPSMKSRVHVRISSMERAPPWPESFLQPPRAEIFQDSPGRGIPVSNAHICPRTNVGYPVTASIGNFIPALKTDFPPAVETEILWAIALFFSNRP